MRLILQPKEAHIVSVLAWLQRLWMLWEVGEYRIENFVIFFPNFPQKIFHPLPCSLCTAASKKLPCVESALCVFALRSRAWLQLLALC